MLADHVRVSFLPCGCAATSNYDQNDITTGGAVKPRMAQASPGA
jgi:hypothetical protein